MTLKRKRQPMKNDCAPGDAAGPASGSEKFDPFANRTARDLRNSLSVALAQALAAGRPDIYHQLTRRWRACGLSAGCRGYLADRLERYNQAFATCNARPGASPMETALVLWNLGLFFEVHEVVERLWRAAGGGRREALKGLVQAAGVFVHLEAGRLEPATRLAARAAQRLERWRKNLPEISNLDDLLAGLGARPIAACRLVFARPSGATGGRHAQLNIRREPDQG